EDPRVRFFRNEENVGPCASRNTAIANARGSFITGLDDDDYFLPTRLSSFLTFWEKRTPNTIALYSNMRLIRKSSKPKTVRRTKQIRRGDLIFGNYVGNQIFTSTDAL